MPKKGGVPENLTPFKTGWKHQPTRTVRVPIVFADATVEFVRRLDSGEDVSEIQPSGIESESLIQVIEGLEDLVQTPRNNFNAARRQKLIELIDALRSLTQVKE